jgi:hypothetical protein
MVNQVFVFSAFRYVLISRSAVKTDDGRRISKTVKLIQQSAFTLDTSFQVIPPKVSRASQEIYRQYVERGRSGASKPSLTDLMKYQKYASNSTLQRDDRDDSL